MKLALYQGPSPKGDVAYALKKVEHVLSSAADAGAEMTVFPELFLPGYNQPDQHHSMAQPQGGPWEHALSVSARKANCGLTIGWAEEHNGRIYNSTSCFDRQGNKLAHYKKLQLFGPMEKAVFEPGDAYSIFNLGGYKAALLICYDVEFSEHVRRLSNEGVKLLLVPTANPAQFDNVPKIIVRARALETGMTIVYANYCGSEGDLEYGGLSLIVGPDGETLVEAGRDEKLLFANLEHVAAIDPDLLSTQKQDFREVATL